MRMNKRWMLILVSVVALASIVWTVQAQRRSSPSSAWDYKVVYDGNGDRGVESRLNQIASQGWELVSVTHVEGSSEIILFLKRPIQQRR